MSNEECGERGGVGRSMFKRKRRKRLHELDTIDRGSVIYGSLVSTVAVAVVALVFFVLYVPGEAREVVGTVVFVDAATENSSLSVSRSVYVRLDDGHTVSARVDGSITPKIGKRALLRATKMPLLGVERFRFIDFAEGYENQLIETPQQDMG